MEIDLNGFGAILLGIAALIGALASGYSTIVNTRKIRDIDHAVNGKGPGAQTMQSQITELHGDREEEEEHRDRSLPPPPRIPPEINGTDLATLMQLLVADMYERRQEQIPRDDEDRP